MMLNTRLKIFKNIPRITNYAGAMNCSISIKNKGSHPNIAKFLISYKEKKKL